MARQAALLVLAFGLVALAGTLLVGFEAKGSQRWIAVGGFSFQPIEFVKPAFAVIAAWLISEKKCGCKMYPAIR